jgi:hypothetical protein
MAPHGTGVEGILSGPDKYAKAIGTSGGMYEYKTAFFPRPTVMTKVPWWDCSEPGGWSQIYIDITSDGAFVVFRRVRFGCDHADDESE